MTRHDLHAVVVTWNSEDEVPGLVAALRSTGLHDDQLVFVDNASQDRTVERLQELTPSAVIIRKHRNAGYGAAINAGLRVLPETHPVLVLNPDTRPEPDAVSRMLRIAGAQDVGLVAPALVDQDGRRLPSVRRDPTWWRTLAEAVLGGEYSGKLGIGELVLPPPASPTEIDWCTGAAMLITPLARARVPAWEESYFLYSEEVDYCQRVRDAGLRIVLDPRAVVLHEGGELHTDEGLWGLRVANRVLHAHRQLPPVSAGLFHLTSLLFETRRKLLARPAAPDVLGLRGPGLLLAERDRLLPDDVDAPLSQALPIIVPAHREGVRVARTLRCLLADTTDEEFDIVVVVNGSTDETAAAARSVVGPSRVIEVVEASKTNAIRIGEAHLGVPDGRPIAYMDADVGLTTRAARRLARLVRREDIEAVSPTPSYVLNGSSWLVRSYLRFWQHLPFTHDALSGTGVYVLAPEARARFEAWPDVTNDDGWINALVPRERRRRAPDAISRIDAPADLAELVRRKHRVERGNVALRTHVRGATPPTTVRDLGRIVIHRPWLLLDLPAFLWVTLRHRQRRGRAPETWR